MKRRELTDEQKERAEARKERFRAHCQRLAAMSEAERVALICGAGGAVMTCEGRALSEVNTALLIFQLSGVSVVGGFRQWKKAGRCVKKGERGLSIWIPSARGGGEDEGKREGEISGRELAALAEGPRFLTGTVFDISQTAKIGEGPPVDESDSVEGVAAEPVEAAELTSYGESKRCACGTHIPADRSFCFNPQCAPAPSGVSLIAPAVVASVWGEMPAWGAPAVQTRALPAPARPSNVVEADFTLEGGRE